MTQSGLMRRSEPSLKVAVNFVRNGEIGKIRVVLSFHIQSEWPVGIAGPEHPPQSRPHFLQVSLVL